MLKRCELHVRDEDEDIFVFAFEGLRIGDKER
jgi:hypothetical protein